MPPRLPGDRPVVMRSLPWNRRTLGLALLALTLLLGLLILGTPAASRLTSGSTWHRGPAGYSAWYEALEQQGVAVQRWQRPVSELLTRLEDNFQNDDEAPAVTLIQDEGPAPADTLLVVLPGFIEEPDLPALLPWVPEWVEAGHRLVVLGVKTPATAAPFSQTLASEAGPVQIDTRRRSSIGFAPAIVLRDDYGAVVWQESLAGGQFTVAATPHLGANAYRNQPGNFALLTALVTEAGGRVWVDEYVHGYRDEEAIAAEIGGSWVDYLARTPLVILVAQVLAVSLLALLAYNRRLGQRRALPQATLDNSQAYIQALAGVLHKAGSHDFVVQTLGQAERLRLQKSLGLGPTPLPIEQLQAAWNAQLGRPATDLAAILYPTPPQGERQLRDWLKRLQSLQPLTQETLADHE
ncbi:DUF4350 domain-containing protein [Nodosilinea sp. E11]|uniref:DUF4350 domain-containing protein n=1 Tax=Nodosilinea sp. E11 TaxID=3037479 RepID=UPI0029341A73|nr:DUF4350 domain-containing protein [Nodosilinea sp. E11]WOD41798.1 DUF4350 domain-containing protein [Nodosilinea sp. E11]